MFLVNNANGDFLGKHPNISQKLFSALPLESSTLGIPRRLADKLLQLQSYDQVMSLPDKDLKDVCLDAFKYGAIKELSDILMGRVIRSNYGIFAYEKNKHGFYCDRFESTIVAVPFRPNKTFELELCFETGDLLSMIDSSASGWKKEIKRRVIYVHSEMRKVIETFLREHSNTTK